MLQKRSEKEEVSLKWNSILLKNHALEKCGCKNEKKKHPAHFTYYFEYSFLDNK